MALDWLIYTPDDESTNQVQHLFYVVALATNRIVSVGPTNLEIERGAIGSFGAFYEGFRPFGLADAGDSVLLVSNERLFEINKKTFSCVEVERPIPAFLGTHQIAYDADVTYFANAANDSISIWDGNETVFVDVEHKKCVSRPKQPDGRYGANNKHINSITIHGDNVFYCLNNFKNSESEFWVFDKKTMKHDLVCEMGSMCHNIVILEDRLLSLSSGTGGVVSFDMNRGAYEGEQIVCDPKEVFLRGARRISEREIYIGGSRELKAHPKQGVCQIGVFDLKENSYAKRLEISESYRINDFLLF